MLNKIVTKTIDIHQIITGLGQLTPDPEATKAASVAPLANLNEAKQLEAKHRQHGALIKGSGVAGKRAAESDKQLKAEKLKPVFDVANPQHKEIRSDAFQRPEFLKKAKKDYDNYETERKDKLGAARLLNKEMIPEAKNLQKLHENIKRENPIFGHPGIGEYIDAGTKICCWIDEHEVDGVVVAGSHGIHEDSELETSGVLLPVGQTVAGLIQKFMAKGENEAVTIEGEIVADYRAKTYHFQDESGGWGSLVISELGQLPGEFHILDADLTDEQRAEIAVQAETERIENLTEAERLAEYNGACAGLANQAQQKENELKFGGDPDFMSKSQEWYNSQLVILKTKYGVTI